MKKVFLLLSVAVLMGAAACSSPEKMAADAENVTVSCEPAVLEVVDGKIAATVTVNVPKDYFNPKVITEVIPVIVYEGGEAAMEPIKYQGDKVKDNYRVVSSEGQTVTGEVLFDYVPGMEKCYLELRGNVLAKKKVIPLPSKKVADGANTTYMLVKQDGVIGFKADDYQEVITRTAEGQIKYELNSSEVRSSELKGSSVKDFQDALDQIAQDERATITGTEIVAYASPDGAEALNDKLSGNRSSSAAKAWKKVTKGHEAADPSVRSAGEDWEGFQQLVSESNIEDKDLILRVLSMYSDPAVRENEIKNMSQVYTALKGEVLPELRRARLIANVQYQNYSNEELAEVFAQDPDALDEEALLRAASVAKDNAEKEKIYKKSIDKFDSDRARFNLAVVYLKEGKVVEAVSLLANLDTNDDDIQNAKGVIALRAGDLETAESTFNKTGDKANLGVVYILTGRYSEAVDALKDVKGCCHNLALAYILNDQLDAAAAAIHCECPKCAYLKAIIAARQGDASAVKANLEKAYEDESLKDRAASDIEFAGYEI